MLLLQRASYAGIVKLLGSLQARAAVAFSLGAVSSLLHCVVPGTTAQEFTDTSKGSPPGSQEQSTTPGIDPHGLYSYIAYSSSSSGSDDTGRAAHAAAAADGSQRSPVLHPRQLNALISSASSPLQLLQLVQAHADAVDAIAVSTAYRQLQRWAKEGGATFLQGQELQQLLQTLKKHLQQQLLQQQQRQLELQPRVLASILHASARLRCKHTMQLLLPAFLQQPVLATANPHDISNVLWAVQHAGGSLRDWQLQRLLSQLCARRSEARPQEISSSISMVATAGRRIQQHQLRRLLSAFCDTIQQATAQHITRLLWGIATMRRLRPALRQQRPSSNNTVQQAREQYPQAAEASTAAAAGAAAAREWLPRIPVSQLQPLLAAFTQQLRTATSKEVANTLWACAEMQVVPTPLLQALQEQPQQLQRLLANAHMQELGSMAWAVGQLDSSTELVGEVLKQAVQRLDQEPSSFERQPVCNMCWAAAVLDLQEHVPHVLQLVQACQQHWHMLQPTDMRQLFQVQLWLSDMQQQQQQQQQPPAAVQGLLCILTEQQLQQCRSSWEAQLLSSSSTTHLQQQLHEALLRLPASTWQQLPALEQKTADGAFSIDVQAVTATGKHLAIELDGPLHHVVVVDDSAQPTRTVPQALNGPTAFRNRALAARGYILLRFSTKQVATAANLDALVLERLREVGCVVP